MEDCKWVKHVTNGSIADTFITHFQNLFQADLTAPIYIRNLNWNPINHLHHNYLCAPFNEVEVKTAINSLDTGKALELDGFTVIFYKKMLGSFEKESNGSLWRLS